MNEQTILQYNCQAIDPLGITCADLDYLQELGIEWQIDPTQLLESAPFSEFELADLRDNGISLESDNQFLQKNGIAPLDGSF
jgi:hypothetical protein